MLQQWNASLLNEIVLYFVSLLFLVKGFLHIALGNWPKQRSRKKAKTVTGTGKDPRRRRNFVCNGGQN